MSMLHQQRNVSTQVNRVKKFFLNLLLGPTNVGFYRQGLVKVSAF